MNDDYDWADELSQCLPEDELNFGLSLDDAEYFVDPEESISFSSLPVATASDASAGTMYFLSDATTAGTYAALTRSITPTWRSSTW